MKFIFVLIIYCLSLPALAQRLILLHTNDHHGAFMSSMNGEFGMAAQATLIDRIRDEAKKNGDHVILLSGGDINTGPPESNIFNAKPDFEAMNLMEFDAMALGNHEFDKPAHILKEQQRIANFEFLASNIVDADGKSAFTPYITREIGGKSIAIVGYTTPDTPKLTPQANTEGLTFRDPAEASRELVQKLKKEHAMVIGLSHLGYFPDESHGSLAPGDETLAKRVPELDVIVGAHTHTEIPEPVKIGNTLIVQAKESGEFVGKMVIDLSSGKPVMESYELIPVKGIPPKKAMVDLLQPYLDEGNKLFSRVVGTAGAGFEGKRANIVAAEHPAGNFIAEAQRTAAGADITIARGKSLRNGFNPGEVQLRNLHGITPLGHVIVTADLNGEEVWRFAEAAKKTMMVPTNRPYFSNGFQIDIKDDKIVGIALHGKPIPNKPEGKYKVSATDAITEMIDEFNFIRQHPTFKSTGIADVDASEAYLKKVGTLSSERLTHGTFEATRSRAASIPICIRQKLLNLR
jgi:5'-nucleotidase / UDP-sugar diphosphatase